MVLSPLVLMSYAIGMSNRFDSCRILQNMKPAREENLRLEYEKTQEMTIHYDTMNWGIGAILIAGVFGMVGLSGDNREAYPLLALLSAIVLFIWRVYYMRHKAIQKIKFQRLQEIEKELHMQQHLLVNCADKAGKLYGIKGDWCAWLITIGVPAGILSMYFMLR